MQVCPRQCPRPLFYLLNTADLPTPTESTTATFADDITVVTTDSDPAIASQKLQTDLLAIQNWFKKLRMKANESKSIYVTLNIGKQTCPPPSAHVNDVQLPQKNVKYLRLHLSKGSTNTDS
jgi:hypothetical protein